MFTYLQPKMLDEAADMLRTYDDIRIMAGGTDLLVGLREGAPCRYVMDIKRIPDMNVMEMTDAGLVVGGAVSLSAMLKSEYLTGCYSVLRDAGLRLANHLLRNRATLVGNVCNASPGGDMIGAALVLGAHIEAVSGEGVRKIPLKEFFTGVKAHVLRGDELAVRAVFPKLEGRGVYLKKQRIRGHDLAQVGVTVFRHGDGRFDIALGAVAPTPVLLEGVVLAGEAPDVEKAIEKVLLNINPITDVRGSREYRVTIAEHFIRQAFALLMQEEGVAS